MCTGAVGNVMNSRHGGCGYEYSSCLWEITSEIRRVVSPSAARTSPRLQLCNTVLYEADTCLDKPWVYVYSSRKMMIALRSEEETAGFCLQLFKGEE